MSFWQLLKSLWDRHSSVTATGDGSDAVIGGTVATAEPQEQVVAPQNGERWWTPAEAARTDMPPLAPPAFTTEALALDHLLEAFSEHDNLRLPSLPKVAERALRLVDGNSADARVIARELENDQVIAAAVLRLANCSLYAGMERVRSLQTAVARLGATSLRMVLFEHSLAAVASRSGRRDERLASFVWNGSLASAVIMRELAALVSMDGEEAYLLGLLHDIGNLLVLLEAQDQQAILRCRLDVDAFAWLCRKHHERLGQLIAGAWNLPDRVQLLAAAHHAPVDEGAGPSREVAMLEFTDMAKCMLGYLPPAAFDLPGSAPAAILGLAGSAELGSFLDSLPEKLSGVAPTF